MDNNERDEFFDPPMSPAPPAGSDGQAPARAGEKSKAVRIAAIVLGVILIAVAAFLGGWYGRYFSLDHEVRDYLWAKSMLEKNYYQPLDDAELYQRMFESLSVDSYTKYYSPADYEKYLKEGAGDNTDPGISIYIGQDWDEITHIFEVTENSPACLAGLKKGMYVLAFGPSENELTEGNYRAFRQFLSSWSGEFTIRCGYDVNGSDAACYTLKSAPYQASFLVYRDSGTSYAFRGEGDVLDLTQTNEPLKGLNEKTAYIRLNEFSGGNTASEFVSLLKTMKERSRTDLILDLRSNGGGYMDLFGSIASHLMRNAEDKYPVVAVTKTRSGQTTRYVCVENDFDSYFEPDSKIYVLADEHTASASECLIGVLVDYGTCDFSDIYLRENESGIAKTYGKGIMQSSYTASNGAAMKMTTATVNWPLSGRCIHGVGVTPADGAIAVPGPLNWGESDPMLETLLSRLSA